MKSAPPPLPADLSTDRLLRPGVAARLVGVDRSTLYRWVHSGRLSAPRKLSPRVTGWPAREIRALIEGAA